MQAMLGTDLSQAGELIREGRLVAFPTETVYGLGANALDPVAVAGIFAAKGRPHFDPLIVHVRTITDLKPLIAEFPPSQKIWPNSFGPAL